MTFPARACMAALLTIVPSVSVAATDEGRIEYPQTRRVDQIDDYFGTKVADPYRWLEKDVRSSPEVAQWAAAENKVTTAYLGAIPQRPAIRRRLAELWNFAQYSPPTKQGDRYYYFKNDGLQNQPVLYTMETPNGESQMVLDPNQWSKDGTIALAGVGFSDDGRYLAYGRAEAGSDWVIWHVMEIASRKVLSDELKWTKFSGVSWSKDGKGFFYTRYDKPGVGDEFQALNFNNKLCYHRLGTPQSADVLVYWRREHPEWMYDAAVTEDGRYLIISITVGSDDRRRILVRDLTEAYAMPVELVDKFEHAYDFVGNDGSVLYFRTDLDAPRRRLVAIDLAAASRAVGKLPMREIIPQTEATLVQVTYVGHRFIASYLRDAASQVKVFSADGQLRGDLELPAIGIAAGFGGKQRDTETFYSFSSIVTPPSIYRYDIDSGKSYVWRRPKVTFNPDDYQVKQVFYSSKDGTRVPMFIAHKKGIKLDGSNAALLYGYGGFNISVPPVFSVARLAWMEMGGVYAQPSLRGGGEYGEAWHQAGIKLKKQNVFDDFIAAAEWLIEQRYTRPNKLAINGGSNGGLLVGAVMTQRPDLFGACLPQVGVMDMLRFQKFTEGRTWVDDYGSSDNPKEFKALLAYSPYHNIKPGVCYPATLVSTADTDDRVVPAHSFKFAAALQHAQSCQNPVLIRISTRSGHGGGKPLAKRIEETADQWSFLVKNLGMAVTP